MNCRQPHIAVQYFFVLFVDVQSSWATNSPQPLPPGGCRGLSRHLDLSLFCKRSSLQTATSPDTLSRSFSFLLPFPLTFLFSLFLLYMSFSPFLFFSFTFLLPTRIKPPLLHSSTLRGSTQCLPSVSDAGGCLLRVRFLF